MAFAKSKPKAGLSQTSIEVAGLEYGVSKPTLDQVFFNRTLGNLQWVLKGRVFPVAKGNEDKPLNAGRAATR